MLEVFPPEIQILIFYSPVFVTILVTAYLIHKITDKGWRAIQNSSYAWLGSSIAVTLLFYLRITDADYPLWVKLIIFPAIFVTSLISYFQLREIKKADKK